MYILFGFIVVRIIYLIVEIIETVDQNKTKG